MINITKLIINEDCFRITFSIQGKLGKSFGDELERISKDATQRRQYLLKQAMFKSLEGERAIQ
ncbi:MAG: hypothetical protein SFV19_04265 [Rhodospirillaceae bacterium]|nr:hypothetical protein [Rhodospirillaceae bacterium]